LLRIRSGLWTFDQVVDYANESEQKMNSLYNTTKLPHSSNKVFLDCLCQKAVERYIDAK
jgi:hypothetical protein